MGDPRALGRHFTFDGFRKYAADRLGAFFANLILTRIQAYGRGDVGTYMPMLAEGFVHVSDRGERRTKTQMREYVRHGASRASYRVSALSLRDGAGKVTDCLFHLTSGQAVVSQRVQ